MKNVVIDLAMSLVESGTVEVGEGLRGLELNVSSTARTYNLQCCALTTVCSRLHQTSASRSMKHANIAYALSLRLTDQSFVIHIR